jgi:hypothetical protein
MAIAHVSTTSVNVNVNVVGQYRLLLSRRPNRHS